MFLCDSGLCSMKGAIAILFKAKLQLNVSGVNICCFCFSFFGSPISVLMECQLKGKGSRHILGFILT